MNLQYALDLPDTAAARDILGMLESVPVYGRPIIDTAASTFTKRGNNGAVYRRCGAGHPDRGNGRGSELDSPAGAHRR